MVNKVKLLLKKLSDVDMFFSSLLEGEVGFKITSSYSSSFVISKIPKTIEIFKVTPPVLYASRLDIVPPIVWKTGKDNKTLVNERETIPL